MNDGTETRVRRERMSPSAFMGKGVSPDTHPNLHHYCLISNGLATMAFAVPGAGNVTSTI
jgi:hypothetical protein